MVVPSIRYLEACRETEDKNILGKRVGYSGGGWRQGANNGARGSARAQITGAKLLLGSSGTFIFFFCKKLYKVCKKMINLFYCRWMNSIRIK